MSSLWRTPILRINSLNVGDGWGLQGKMIETGRMPTAPIQLRLWTEPWDCHCGFVSGEGGRFQVGVDEP